tara:strand:- start:896 stop:1180 length:285 start_codon:yes stop_codon:yes gene_type:complete
MDNKDSITELVDIVLRQTNYNKETALQKLEEFEYDPLKVIRNYMNPDNKVYYTKNEPKTTNQLMYKEIRTMLDSANAKYRKKKEDEEEAEKANN